MQVEPLCATCETLEDAARQKHLACMQFHRGQGAPWHPCTSVFILSCWTPDHSVENALACLKYAVKDGCTLHDTVLQLATHIDSPDCYAFAVQNGATGTEGRYVAMAAMGLKENMIKYAMDTLGYCWSDVEHHIFIYYRDAGDRWQRLADAKEFWDAQIPVALKPAKRSN